MYKGNILVKKKENWIMAKGVLAFLKSVFSKPVIKTQETVAR